MEIELHQIELRYAALRVRSAQREARLLASLASAGQTMPVVVVREGDRFVLIDGYKRVRALGTLGRDTAVAIEWSLDESEALLFERLLRAGDADSAIEQGWFLREMHERFGLSQQDLARRFGRTQSWVSRRIALAMVLPAAAQARAKEAARLEAAPIAKGAVDYLSTTPPKLLKAVESILRAYDESLGRNGLGDPSVIGASKAQRARSKAAASKLQAMSPEAVVGLRRIREMILKEWM